MQSKEVHTDTLICFPRMWLCRQTIHGVLARCASSRGPLWAENVACHSQVDGVHRNWTKGTTRLLVMISQIQVALQVQTG